VPQRLDQNLAHPRQDVNVLMSIDVIRCCPPGVLEGLELAREFVGNCPAIQRVHHGALQQAAQWRQSAPFGQHARSRKRGVIGEGEV
jgi:hypothetical protein